MIICKPMEVNLVKPEDSVLVGIIGEVNGCKLLARADRKLHCTFLNWPSDMIEYQVLIDFWEVY